MQNIMADGLIGYFQPPPSSLLIEISLAVRLLCVFFINNSVDGSHARQ